MANEKLREAVEGCVFVLYDSLRPVALEPNHPCWDALLLAAANEPKVQVRILRTAGMSVEHGVSGALILANAIEKGEVKLEVRG